MPTVAGQAGEPTALARLLDDTFFASVWRRRPVVLRGCVGDLLPDAPSDDAVRSLRRAVELIAAEPVAGGPVIHTIDAQGLVFVERTTTEVEWLRSVVRDAVELFEWDGCWCDLVVSDRSATFGSHFDPQDNFSMQLAGAKSWLLSPPVRVSAGARWKRFIGNADAGGALLADQALSVTLKPGDMIYVPEGWVHHATSVGASASVTLAVSVPIPLHLDGEDRTDAASRQREWVAPMDAGPGSAQVRAAELDRLRQLPHHPCFDSGRRRPRGARANPVRDATRVLGRVADLARSGQQDPSPHALLSVESVAAARLAAGVSLVRLLVRTVVDRWRAVDDEHKALYEQTLAILATMDAVALAGFGATPEARAWTLSASLTARATSSSGFDIHGAPLMTALAAEATERQHPIEPLLVLGDSGGGVSLRRANVHLPGPAEGEAVLLLLGDGDPRIEASETQESQPLRRLPAMAAEGPCVVGLPSALRSACPTDTMTEAEVTSARTEVEAALRDLEALAPESARLVAAALDVVAIARQPSDAVPVAGLGLWVPGDGRAELVRSTIHSSVEWIDRAHKVIDDAQAWIPLPRTEHSVTRRRATQEWLAAEQLERIDLGPGPTGREAAGRPALAAMWRNLLGVSEHEVRRWLPS